MRSIVECVPNVSEGRDTKVVEAIAAGAAGAGVKLLDVQSDQAHNRSVLTFIGSPEACKSAAFAVAERAVKLIDLGKHHGAHPRIGSVDVIPFVPIQGVTLEECAALAHALGRELWERLRLPVYFYESAALRPDRRNLEDVRKGNYEGLREAVKADVARRPDLGGPELHPTAGAAVVGARPPLIAYNVNLASEDVELAKRIAKSIRTSSGGMPCVKAMGLALADKGLVQVSMNLTDFRVTPIHVAYEAVRSLAAEAGVEVSGSEVVGLVPLDALMGCTAHFLKLAGFRTDQVLENRLLEE